MGLLLVGAGALLSLVLGAWHWLRADTLTAFVLYQFALGLADLLSQWLRGSEHSRWATAIAGLWLASLVALAAWPQPRCTLVALAAAALLAAVHRPDVALFAAMTLPVSLLLIGTALWRGEPLPYGLLALLVAMAGVVWWRRRGST
ncbi:MAG: hypothetical protein ACOX3S_13895 [Anaerolineae bacterium]|jgi:hypothetical protein